MGKPTLDAGARALADTALAGLRIAGLVLLMGGSAASHHPVGGHEARSRDGQQALLAQMHEACVSAMIRSTCQVMVGSAPATATERVVIAGVGQIDAQAYRALRESGDAMCGVARQACAADWDGASCRSARALWSTQQVAVLR